VKFESEYLAKIRPVFTAFHQPGANGVLAHIMPFFGIETPCYGACDQKSFLQYGGDLPSRRSTEDNVPFRDFNQFDKLNFSSSMATRDGNDQA